MGTHTCTIKPCPVCDHRFYEPLQYPRATLPQVADLRAAENRIAELEAENAKLRAAMMDVANTLANTLTRTVI